MNPLKLKNERLEANLEFSHKVIEESAIIRNGGVSDEKLVELLTNPAKPSEYLQQSANTYRQSKINIKWDTSVRKLNDC